MSYLIIASPDNNRRHAIKQQASTLRMLNKWRAAFTSNGWSIHRVIES